MRHDFLTAINTTFAKFQQLEENTIYCKDIKNPSLPFVNIVDNKKSHDPFLNIMSNIFFTIEHLISNM